MDAGTDFVLCPRCRMHAYRPGTADSSMAAFDMEICPGCVGDEEMIWIGGEPPQSPKTWPVLWLPITVELGAAWERHLAERDLRVGESGSTEA